jgi:hypothetical protein
VLRSADNRNVTTTSTRSRRQAQHGPRHGHGAPIPTTLVKVLLVVGLVLVPAIEAGSWFITRVQLEDDAASVAVEAADAVGRSPANSQTAKTAYEIATQELKLQGGGQIDPKTLRLFKDGTVRFTAHRAAPSLLLGHFDWGQDVMDVHVEVEGRSIDAGDLPLVPDNVADNLPRSTP